MSSLIIFFFDVIDVSFQGQEINVKSAMRGLATSPPSLQSPATAPSLEKFKNVLSISKCYALTRYYLGFNGISSEISILEGVFNEQLEVQGYSGKNRKNYYRCSVNLAFNSNSNSKSVIAVGIGTSSVANMPANFNNLQEEFLSKTAVSNALKDAFSKACLVIFADGRVHVEVMKKSADDPFLVDDVYDAFPASDVDHIFQVFFFLTP